MTNDSDATLEEVVEAVLREWERADLGPEGAGVRRGIALEIRLAMRKASRRVRA